MTQITVGRRLIDLPVTLVVERHLDGKLVRVRDRNCGTGSNKVYGKLDKKEVPQLGKCSSGVCGK